jgi:hypothetical protein
MRLLPKFTFRSPVAAQFVPSGRFFLRFVPLAPNLPALPQAELALEGLAPFPPAQLFWGCCVSPDRTGALVYAAHRRRFTPEESAGWEHNDLTVPDLLPLLGAAPASAGLRIHQQNNGLNGAAWNGLAPWPVAVHSREYPAGPTEEHRRQFVAELAAKAGLPEAPVVFIAGTPRARREGGRLIFELVDAAGVGLSALVVPVADLDALDVRDRAGQERRRRDRRRGALIWQVLLAALGAAGLAAGLDLGALTLHLVDRALNLRVAAQAPFVSKLETGHSLSARIDELTHRRLRFFEMLAAINEPRPHSIQFTRLATSGHNAFEVEAQTGTADDVGTYETALHRLTTLEKVEIRDLRARDGITTFGLTVVFKPELPTFVGGRP